MRGLLIWLLRIVVVAVVLRALFRLLAGAQRRRQARRPDPDAGRSGGTLVRDPQCGTYVPTSRAVKLVSAGGTQFFCSATCRDAYAAANIQGSNPVAKRV